MKNNIVRTLVHFLVVLPLVAQLGQRDGSKERREQRSFSAEDIIVERPVPVPTGVLAIIERDPDVRNVLVLERPGLKALPREWLQASEIFLGDAEKRALVVVAKGLLRGANVTTFWLFSQRDGTFEMLLKAVGHTLTVGAVRSQGYREVIVLSATAVDSSEAVFKFQGKRYHRVSVSRLTSR